MHIQDKMNYPVDATTRHEMLSFMVGYCEYNQFPIDRTEKEHTTLMIDQGLHCHKVIPFGLENAGTKCSQTKTGK